MPTFLIGNDPPSPTGNPGYAPPLALSVDVPVVESPMPMFYGDPGLPVPQPTHEMAAIVRGTQRHTQQQYDPRINYANDSFDYARSTPFLDMYASYSGPFPDPQAPIGGMSGMGYAWQPPDMLQELVSGSPDIDWSMEMIGNPEHPYSIGMPIVASDLAGLGLTQTIKQAPPDQTVSLPLPQPVKSSTIFGVVGGSLALVAASVAIYAFFSLRKK